MPVPPCRSRMAQSCEGRTCTDEHEHGAARALAIESRAEYMYFNLFQLASLAMVGWIPLIFVPTWSGSRRLADSAFFPIYIAVLYAFGVGALVMQFGPGFIADFGTAD